MIKVDGQNVINVIHESIRLFGSDDRVGARRIMPCDGVTVDMETRVHVFWGLYSHPAGTALGLSQGLQHLPCSRNHTAGFARFARQRS
ncbi:hypothetical protein B0I37DRAFT_375768 [Chaetomium sp. MPI-CAGE-AT-0009]|nr:hypothetical protein B0I37DRAFT_375768 [Chaetomium sp. MPI-CAGE-AT-0009]